MKMKEKKELMEAKEVYSSARPVVHFYEGCEKA
jgi:hypothetical protein